jgi:hypothetical protein
MMQILINLFIDTIFFGIFFPDTGVCDAILFETGIYIHTYIHTHTHNIYFIHILIHIHTLYTLYIPDTGVCDAILFETDCLILENSVVSQPQVGVMS